MSRYVMGQGCTGTARLQTEATCQTISTRADLAAAFVFAAQATFALILSPYFYLLWLCRLFSSREKTATTEPSAGPDLLRSSSEPDRCCTYSSHSFFAALGLCTRHEKVPPLHPAGLCQSGHPRPLPVRVS